MQTLIYLIIICGIFLLYLGNKDENKLRKFFLLTNVALFNYSLLILLKFNKLFIGYQYMYKITLTYSKEEYLVYFGVDGLSLFFIILTFFLITLCILITVEKYYKISQLLWSLYITEFLLVLSFSAVDLIFFFIFFESVLMPVYYLIIVWGSHVRRVLAGYYLYLYTFFGSAFIFIAICSILMECGTTNFLVLQAYAFNNYKQIYLSLLFFLGFSIKIPSFPFHLWLPEAHVEAPTEGSVILAGLLLKLGGYAFIRILINLFPYGSVYISPLIVLSCATSILYSSLIAIRQDDIKKLIAYASIAHMNYLCLGIFTGSVYGLVGALILMIAHGLVSSGLFMCAGFLYDRYQTRQIEYYGGLSSYMPIFSVFFFLLSVGNFGFPLTVNFIGELLILFGLVDMGFFTMLAAGIALFFSVIYSMYSYNKITAGNVKTYIRKIKDLSIAEFNALFNLILLMFVFGIVPNSIINVCYMSLKFISIKFYGYV